MMMPPGLYVIRSASEFCQLKNSPLPEQCSGIRTKHRSPRCACMAKLSSDQKRIDVWLGNTVLGVLFLVAVSSVLLWLVILPS